MKSKFSLTVMVVLLGLLILPANLVKGQSCDNLISLWRLEEKSGGVYTDFIGGHNATAYASAPVQDVGKVGKAQSFNGTSNFITVSDHPDFDWAGDQSFTIEMWVKLKSISAVDNMIFIGRDANVGSIHWWVGAAKNTGQSMFTLINSDGTSNISFGPNLSIGTWYHIVAVRDAIGGKNKFYVNNTQVDIDKVDYSAGSFSTDATIDMGVLNFNGAYDRFYAPVVLDEVAIYNIALTATDIDAHYDNGVFGIGYCEDYSPYFLSEPDSLAVVSETFNYEAFATGLPTLQYSLVSGPGSINSSTGVLSWTPTSVSQSGTTFTISATNSQGTAFQSFYVYVAEAPSCPGGIKNLWKLDEISGPPYIDFKGGNDGEALVAPVPTAGKFNGALQFDGSSRGINVPDDGTYNFGKSSSFSFEYWMKTSTKGAYEVCMGRQGTIGDVDTSLLHMWVGIDKTTGRGVFALVDAHGNMPPEGHIIAGPDLTDNTWHYVVAVRDGVTKKNYLYVDGSEVGSTEPFTYINSFGTHEGDPFNIGFLSRNNGTPAYFFSGALDEAAIYTKALSANEVSNNYLSSFVGDWHCQPGNFAPVFTTEPIQSALEDELYTYNIATNDIDDGDVLILSASTKPDWLNFTDLGNGKGVLSGTPSDGDIGPHSMILSVTDSKTSIDQSFTLTVTNQNDPPMITSTPVLTVNEKSPYTYTVVATDPDVGDVLTYSAITIPDWLSFNPVTHELLGTADNDNVGEHAVSIEVTDGLTPVLDEFTITVINVNDVPKVTDQGVISTNEDTPFTIKVSDLIVVDVDNDQTDLSVAVEGGINYTVEGGSIVPAENYNGLLIVNLRVNDLEGSSDVFGAEVTVIPVNDAPVITSEPSKNAVVGTLYGYLLIATDPDGDDVIMAPISIPGFLSFDAESGVLGGTPTDNDIKSHIVALKVSDGKEEVALNYTLTVTKWPVGIDDKEGAILSVYPVPADKYLIFELNLSEDGVISVYDMTGKQWIQRRVSARDEQVELDVSQLEQGLYMYKVQSGDNMTVKSFVINR